MKLFSICDNIDTHTGLRLCGIEGVVAHTRDDVLAALNNCFDDKNIAVVLVTKVIITLCGDYINEQRLARRSPLITLIPDRHGEGSAMDEINKSLMDAIGVDMWGAE